SAGQERVGCAGQGGLKDLCAEGAYDPVTKISDYPETDWKDITDPEKMWASEGVNSTMMRDFALYIPDGAAKIEALMCTSNTLKQVIAAWAKKYPKDADALAKIIDANTNYTMNKVKLGELLDGKAGAYLDKRAEYETKYKGKDPCDSLKKIFKDDKAKPPVGVGLPPTGGPTGEGKPTGGKGGWPGMKKF
ncbi:MAG: hypothetical protein WCO77_07810, partial [bacterium]